MDGTSFERFLESKTMAVTLRAMTIQTGLSAVLAINLALP
jgi:hypothetical protein